MPLWKQRWSDGPLGQLLLCPHCVGKKMFLKLFCFWNSFNCPPNQGVPYFIFGCALAKARMKHFHHPTILVRQLFFFIYIHLINPRLYGVPLDFCSTRLAGNNICKFHFPSLSSIKSINQASVEGLIPSPSSAPAWCWFKLTNIRTRKPQKDPEYPLKLGPQ